MYDVIVVGAGPAGLACALNLVRTHARVLLLDNNRPRHAATLVAHGFITRDGVAPLELRTLGRTEFLAYPTASFARATVTAIAACDNGYTVAAQVAGVLQNYTAKQVVLATGLREILPPVADIRAYYGTHLHSCLVCDGYEKSGQPLVLVAHPDASVTELAKAKSLAKRFAPEVTVLIADDTAQAPVAAVGEKAKLLGFNLKNGDFFAATAGFVLPLYEPAFLCDTPGVFRVGECASNTPGQLLIAAGSGAAIVPEVLAKL